MINSNSCDFAVDLIRDGKINLLLKKAIPNNNAVFNMAVNIKIYENLPKVVSKGSIITTIISCINKIPRIILPCNVSRTFSSDNNFITIIVDENATINPIYVASMNENQNEANNAPKKNVIIT